MQYQIIGSHNTGAWEKNVFKMPVEIVHRAWESSIEYRNLCEIMVASYLPNANASRRHKILLSMSALSRSVVFPALFSPNLIEYFAYSSINKTYEKKKQRSAAVYNGEKNSVLNRLQNTVFARGSIESASKALAKRIRASCCAPNTSGPWSRCGKGHCRALQEIKIRQKGTNK